MVHLSYWDLKFHTKYICGIGRLHVTFICELSSNYDAICFATFTYL